MIQPNPNQRVFVAVSAVDFRCGIDGLVAKCQKQFAQNPKTGHLFVFRNRRGNALKILCYDENGFLLCQKRFSSGTLKQWPRSSQTLLQLSKEQLVKTLYQKAL